MIFSKSSDSYAKWKLKKAGLRHHILDVDNYTFSYWDSGSKNKPVYFLFHGYGTPTHLQWFQQVKMLSKTHRIILPNLLYFGSIMKGEKKYRTEDQVEAMSILLKELKIDSLILGGYSYGGIVAAELALKEKNKIKMLTIFSSPLKFFSKEDSANILVKGKTKNIPELLVPPNIEVATKFIKLLQYSERRIPKFIIKNFYENLFQDEQKNSNYRALLSDLLSKMDYFKNQDYTFNYPVLLIWGENDELIPKRIGIELKDYFISSELHIIPKAGHLLNIEQKRKFNTVLHEFLIRYTH